MERLSSVQAICRQRTTSGTVWVAHVMTPSGRAISLQNRRFGVLSRRLIDRGVSAAAIAAKVLDFKS